MKKEIATETSSCCPPWFLSPRTPNIWGGELFRRLTAEGIPAEVQSIKYDSRSIGSTCQITTQMAEQDIFGPNPIVPKNISYVVAGEIARDVGNWFASIVLPGKMMITKKEEGKPLRPENAAMLKLLEQWFNEPPLGDDAWWEEFDRELREIREIGWRRANND